LPRRISRAFTLIELLVVIAIIAILAAILFPVFAQARASARKTTCLSNFRQITMAMLMYTSDWDEKFARTQTTDTPGVPGYISWWSIGEYEDALNAYIKNGTGGVSASGYEQSRNDVWWDPSDPDKSDPPMWGSMRNNGLITGVARSMADITSPAHTIFFTLHVEDWKDYECENNGSGSSACEPSPLPINDPNNDFWYSDYFDICLNPWSYTSKPTDTYYWAKGLASPPCEKFPNDPACIFEYQSIDGRCCTLPSAASGAASAGAWFLPTAPPFRNFPPEHPRYAGGHPFAFIDGHVKMLSFDATYVSPQDNMWATNQ
jgi:prepilin-type N-terminal cleavage/methylation domain-containing protein